MRQTVEIAVIVFDISWRMEFQRFSQQKKTLWKHLSIHISQSSLSWNRSMLLCCYAQSVWAYEAQWNLSICRVYIREPINQRLAVFYTCLYNNLTLLVKNKTLKLWCWKILHMIVYKLMKFILISSLLKCRFSRLSKLNARLLWSVLDKPKRLLLLLLRKPKPSVLAWSQAGFGPIKLLGMWANTERLLFLLASFPTLWKLTWLQ